MGEKIGEFLKQAALALLYIFIYDAVQILLSFEAVALNVDTTAATGAIMFISIVATLLLYRVSYYVRGLPGREYTVGKPKLWDILFAAALAIGFRFITSAYFVWADSVEVLSESIENAADYGDADMTVFASLLLILFMWIAGPIFEEVLFRGIVMTRLEKIMPVWLAIVIQGIIFGASHMVLAQSIFTAVLGIIMGYIFYKTGKLSVTIVIHIVFNMSSMIAIEDKTAAAVCAAAGAVVVILSIAMFNVLYGKKKQALIEEAKEE